MILTDEEIELVNRHRAATLQQVKIDARDLLTHVLSSVTEEVLGSRPNHTFLMETEAASAPIRFQTLDAVVQILELMGLEFVRLGESERTVEFKNKIL
jgi:hypothetical protein